MFIRVSSWRDCGWNPGSSMKDIWRRVIDSSIESCMMEPSDFVPSLKVFLRVERPLKVSVRSVNGAFSKHTSSFSHRRFS